MNEAHVIMLNDSPMFVFIGKGSKAMDKMLELSQAYYEEHRHHFGSKENYKARCIWHIRTVMYNAKL